jgi:hypothetical protein
MEKLKVSTVTFLKFYRLLQLQLMDSKVNALNNPEVKVSHVNALSSDLMI